MAASNSWGCRYVKRAKCSNANIWLISSAGLAATFHARQNLSAWSGLRSIASSKHSESTKAIPIAQSPTVLLYPRRRAPKGRPMARSTWGGLFSGFGRTLAAALTLVVMSGPLAAQTSREIQDLADQVIRRLDLQTEFPVEFPPQPLFTIPSEVLWVVIIIAIVILLYAFRDLIPGLRARQASWASDAAEFSAAKNGAPAVALGAADQLAAEGRYVEAMHVLLLQSLTAIRERLDEQFSDSFTSREILRSTRLPEAGRTPLGDMIQRVELTYFGQQPAAFADYAACRASFNALAQTLHGSPAA